ncbi:radical SAM protein [bacterium]|nr:MAG: radical SAM protein [bacterium]
MEARGRNASYVKSLFLPELPLWSRIKNQRIPISFDLELTARCNNNCRHCYINLPANDKGAKKRELSLMETKRIIDQAVSLGAFWCLVTGGEPFLRDDFFEIYLYLKKKGLLVSIFTNATLINQEHIKILNKYPPRDIEVTVYGVTQETYENVTRTKGSFGAFMRGLDLLLKNEIKVRFKAMALLSNVRELPLIAKFCRERTKDYFRFDPFLHLRFDSNALRNKEIISERLSPEEIVRIEQQDPERSRELEKNCGKLINPKFAHFGCNHLFHCATGNSNFAVSYDGYFRLCSLLWHPECIYDLKKGELKEAWESFALRVRDMRSNNEEFLNNCRKCTIINLCMWCPAYSCLETAELDKPVEYFCKVAHAREESLKQTKPINEIR